MDLLIYTGSWFMFLASGFCLAVLAQRHRTMPILFRLGLFGLGFTALLAGIGMQMENPCTPWQFLLRVVTFGASLIGLASSMLLKRDVYQRHT